MKISAILHKVGRDNIKSLKDKIARALQENPDIIIGPDASLRGNKNYELSSVDHRDKIYNELQELSKGLKTLIIPGTITLPINTKEIVCEAPVFYNGNFHRVFYKERDNGEGKLALENGYVYKKGNNALNKFEYNGKKIALEICGDHGNQDVRGCDLELILAYDQNAGFWLNSSNNGFARKAIVCDGYEPKIESFDYDPDKNLRINIIKPEICGEIFTFEV